MAYDQFYSEQKINASIDEIWHFISSPRNLKFITPDYMGFDIKTEDIPEKMYEGMIIGYKVSPFLGLKTNWVTEITHIREKRYFVDEQRVGPFSFWHHQHLVEPQEEGIIMKDILTYAPPFGFIGALANSLFIKRKLKQIFDFRTNVIKNRYG